MRDVVIVAAGRSAIGVFNGALSTLSATALGAQLLRELLSRVHIDPATVDEVILGQVLTAGCGQNPARQVAINAGLAQTIPAMTINKVCGSGLKAVQLAAQSIRLGETDLVVAGGMESMSQSGHLLPNSRSGQKMGHWQAIDTMITDGLWDAFNNIHMGITAENLAQKYSISRDQQRKGEDLLFKVDEGPRPETTIEALAKLRPAFKGDGTVTAGNASGINDGAAMVILCSADKARALGLEPLATIKAAASAGVDPE